MNYLDLFSGIGGFALAFKNAGFNFDKHYCSEVDKYAESIYMRHFPDAIQLGDITTVGNELEKIDIFTGGFPCQAFSIAGARRGFEDTRGTLFFDVERLAGIYKPKYMVLENVKGLGNHEGGNTIRVILDKLRGLDYSVQLLLLNTKDFGIPQNRERLFFICNLRGQPRPEISGIRERKTEIACGREYNPGKPDAHRVRDIDGASVTLKSEGGGLGAKTGLYAISTRNAGQHGAEIHADKFPCLSATGYKDQHKVVIPVLTPDRVEERQNGRRFKNPDEDMFTFVCLNSSDWRGLNRNQKQNGDITKNSQDRIIQNIQEHTANTLTSTMYKGSASNGMTNVIQNCSIRRLTPIECERLQGFPDNWTAYGKDNESISDTQRYKCCGNAVTVKVVEEIAKTIRAVL